MRAAWLKAHHLFPFETTTEEGRQRWKSVVESLPPQYRRQLLNEEESKVKSDEEIPQVLEFCRSTSESMEPEEAAMIYIRSNHEYAKGSDYV